MELIDYVNFKASTQSMQSKKREVIYKEYKHNPPHLFRAGSKYFITSSTLDRHHYLKSDEAKTATLNILEKSFFHFNWKIEDWVILDNHIHIMVEASEHADTLPKVMNNFHKFTANWLSKNGIKKIKNKYFHNYWDTCITYQSSYLARLNYIWFNPVKHGYVENPEYWKFGSYYYRFKNKSNEMMDIIKNYSYEKLQIYDDF